MPRRTLFHGEVSPHPGWVREGLLCRILGITEKYILTITTDLEGGWIPFRLHEDVRWYDVDEVMRTAMQRPTRLPLMNPHKRDWIKDEMWAADALSLGPWNCARAPSGRSWWLYLDGKKDPALRRRLSATAHNQSVLLSCKADKVPGVSAGRPRREQPELPEPEIVKAPVGIAEEVYHSLQEGNMGEKIDAPFVFDGGLEEAELPPPQKQETGY